MQAGLPGHMVRAQTLHDIRMGLRNDFDIGNDDHNQQ